MFGSFIGGVRSDIEVRLSNVRNKMLSWHVLSINMGRSTVILIIRRSWIHSRRRKPADMVAKRLSLERIRGEVRVVLVI